MSTEKASGLREIGVISPGQHQADHQIVETGHHLRRVALGHTSTVFMQGHIPAIMQTIFDTPIDLLLEVK